MKRQCLTGDQAVTVKRQHVSPCSDCPFSKSSLRGWLGAYTAPEWMSLAHGEGKSDCHTRVLAGGKPLACAGLATYRANVAKSVHDSKALRLPADRVRVFARPAEFLEHHKSSTEEWFKFMTQGDTSK